MAAPTGWLRIERRIEGQVSTFTGLTWDGKRWTVIREEQIGGLPETLLLGAAAVGNDTRP